MLASSGFWIESESHYESFSKKHAASGELDCEVVSLCQESGRTPSVDLDVCGSCRLPVRAPASSSESLSLPTRGPSLQTGSEARARESTRRQQNNHGLLLSIDRRRSIEPYDHAAQQELRAHSAVSGVATSQAPSETRSLSAESEA